MRKFKRSEEFKKRAEENENLKKREPKTGRRRIGVTRKVSVTLPHGEWENFDKIREGTSRSEVLRELILQKIKEES